MDLHAPLSSEQIAFLAEDELISILPLKSMDAIALISVCPCVLYRIELSDDTGRIWTIKAKRYNWGAYVACGVFVQT
jgi:hypothetical protein